MKSERLKKVIHLFKKNFIVGNALLKIAAFLTICITVASLFKSYLDYKNEKQYFEVSKVFNSKLDGNPDELYYNYLVKKIQNAKKEIWITGEGVDCNKANNVAEGQFIKSLKMALENGTSILRVQTTRKVCNEWRKTLKELKTDYPNKFELWVVKNDSIRQHTSLIALDPDSPENCAVEMLITVEKKFTEGVEKRSYLHPGAGLFIEKNMNLSKGVVKIISDMATLEYSYYVDSPEILDSILILKD